MNDGSLHSRKSADVQAGIVVIVSRRSAIVGMASAASLSGAGAVPNASKDARIDREIWLASKLGIRGDNTAADTDRAQRVIEDAARQRRALYFDGQDEWVFRTSLMLFGSEDKGSSIICGEGAYASVIRCSDISKPVFINDTSEDDFRRLSIRGLTIRGGSRGLHVRRQADQVASLFDFNDVRFEYQKDIGLFCDQYLISCNFDNVVFYYCNRGVYCGRNANNVLFSKPRFEGLNDSAVEFDSPGGGVNGCEDVRFINPRFEGRNQEPRKGAFVVGGYRLSTLTIDGGYFEDSHPVVLRERGGLGQVVFRNCHFSGQSNMGRGFQREEFDSDSIVTLDGNRFVTGTDGPRFALVTGVNRGLSRKRFGYFTEFGGTIRYVSSLVPVTRPETTLLRIAWSNWAAPEDREGAVMTADLVVSILDGQDAQQTRALECSLTVSDRRDGGLRARISSADFGATGDTLAARTHDDGSISISLLQRQTDATRSAIAELRGLVIAEREPPFIIA